ncbi:MAG: hypothetical protein WD061_02895 [Candidatus Saccharimonadales bacterium]
MAKKKRTRKQKERAKARRLQHISSLTTKEVAKDDSSNKQDTSLMSQDVQSTEGLLKEGSANKGLDKIKFSIVIFLSLIAIQFGLWILLRLEMLPQSWIELLS